MAKTSLKIQKERQSAALEEMNSDLKKVYKKIKGKTEAIAKNVVLAMYEVGELVKEVTAKEGKYGEAAVPTLAVALGKQWSANQLWDYRQLANAYTRAGVERLLGMKTAGGNSITLTHLKKLSGLTVAKRKKMQKLVFVEDLTTDELADAILSGANGKKRSGGGRNITPPKTISGGLNQMAKYPEEVGKRVKLWDTHVFGKVVKLSSDECDSELLDQLKSTRDAEKDGIENAQHIVNRLDTAIKRVEGIIAKKKVVHKKASASSNGHATKKKVAKKAPAKKPPVKKVNRTKGAVSAKDRIAAAKKKRSARPAAT